MDIYSIKFGDVDLNNEFFSEVMWHDFDQMPTIDSSVSKVSLVSRSVITQRTFPVKVARVRLKVTGCPLNILQAKVARVRQVLQYKTRDIKLNHGMPIRSGSSYVFDQYQELTYKGATLASIDIDSTGKVSVVEVAFSLLNPIAYGATTQELYSGTSLTAASTAVVIAPASIQGTFEHQNPVYEITFNSVTLGSNRILSLTNGYNTVIYNGVINNGDVIRVVTDPESMSFTRNGLDQSFYGSLPSLLLAGATITLSDTYTSRNRNFKITNTPRYI